MSQTPSLADAGRPLWPPLGLIRSAFARDDATPDGSGDSVVGGPHAPAQRAAPPATERDAAHLLLPLTELAQRREAVAGRAFAARWAPGRLVSVLLDGRLLGVLLDKAVQGDVWQGWMAAGEADWAGAFDVLLEPQDEPFEPMLGLIQTWNPVMLRQTPQLCARVLGEVSATRLEAMRAVHDEWAAKTPLAIDPAPGRIALRTAGGLFSVLSGTPLGADDPRADYQALYRDAALSLTAAAAASSPSSSSSSSSSTPTSRRVEARAAPATGPWARLRGWLAADRWVRPAFAVLALVVVVQNIGFFGAQDDERDVRFRSVPEAAVPAAPELLVRWKPGVRIEDTTVLLQSMSAELVGGPDASGRWRLRMADPVGGVALLSASPWVESVAPP